MIAIFPEIVACVASGNGEKLAVLVRKYFGGDETFAPQPDLKKLMHAAGLEVQILPIASLAALIAKDEAGAFRIVAVLNETVDGLSQRFMLAHMLGHILYDIQPKIASGDWAASGFRETVCPMGRYAGEHVTSRMNADQLVIEDRADRFAAALLMPKSMAERAYQKIRDIEKCGRFFGVTPNCMQRRLQDLGLISEAPVNFIDAETKIQNESAFSGKSTFKHAEPLPEDINPSAQLHMDEARMPRSVAASSYSDASGQSPVSQPTKKQTSQPQEPDSETHTPKPAIKGLARIRELARQLDKSV